MLRNTNKLSGAVAEERLLFLFNLVCPRICIFSFNKNKNISFTFFTMKQTPTPNRSASKGSMSHHFLQTKPFIWLWTPPWLNSHGSGTTLLRAWWWEPLPTPARIRGDVFVCKHFRHDTGNTKVEIVSLLPHGEGEAMVHICHRKYERGLGWT